MVFLEALASGCFPLGTYFAGMAASIDSVTQYLTPEDAQVMRISHNQTELVADIAKKAVEALKICDKYKNILREVAVSKYDWSSIALKFRTKLKEDKNV